jgi:hypothetical protein
MMDIITASGANNCLHYLNVSDDICKARLRARNAEGAHDFSATDEEFEMITRYFAEPLQTKGSRLLNTVNILKVSRQQTAFLMPVFIQSIFSVLSNQSGRCSLYQLRYKGKIVFSAH